MTFVWRGPLAAALGAASGLLLAWATRRKPVPPSDDGVMPLVYVSPTPAWVFVCAAGVGALAGLGLVWSTIRRRRAIGEPGFRMTRTH
jgi:hypothetical protein